LEYVFNAFGLHFAADGLRCTWNRDLLFNPWICWRCTHAYSNRTPKLYVCVYMPRHIPIEHNNATNYWNTRHLEFGIFKEFR